MSKNVIFCCKIYQRVNGSFKKLSGHANVGAEISENASATEVIEEILKQVSNNFGCDKNDIYIENMITL